MKRIVTVLLLFSISGTVAAQTGVSGQAYILYQDAKELYRNKKMAESREKFEEVVKKYPQSRYVPNALFMLSFIETDYIKIIEYLNIIRNSYTDFKYWKEALEKLGDIYYIMGSYGYSLQAYQQAGTDRSLYMQGIIYAADGKHEEAVNRMQTLISQTRDYDLSYKALMVMADSYVGLGRLNSALRTLEESIKLLDYSFDNGSRILFYAGKSYFYKKEWGRALYVFSLLRTSFPLSAESKLAENYLENLDKRGIVVIEPVDWVEKNFTRPAELAFKNEEVGFHDFEMEESAEKRQQEAEQVIGNISSSQVEGYLVRIGEFKDLGVANLVATDLARSDYTFPIGIYFRDDLYYLEIRGIKALDDARNYARQLLSLGYDDTKVIEVVKVTEYER